MKCIDTVPIKNSVVKCNSVIPQDNFIKEIYKCCYYHFSIHDEYKTGCTFLKYKDKDEIIKI